MGSSSNQLRHSNFLALVPSEELNLTDDMEPAEERWPRAVEGPGQMLVGRNQSVLIRGRTFHLQTERCGDELRTEIFLDGRVIASRRAPVGPSGGEREPEDSRAQLDSFHQEVLAWFTERANQSSEPTATVDQEVDQESETTPEIVPGSSLSEEERVLMASVDLQPLKAIDGFLGACLVDSNSGMMLGATDDSSLNLEVAAAGNTEVVRAKQKTMEALRLDDEIEDMLISLGKQYHIIRPLESARTLFLYVSLDRSKSNLAMARHELRSFEATLNLNSVK